MGSRRLRRLQEQAEALRREVTKSQDGLNGDAPATRSPKWFVQESVLEEEERPSLSDRITSDYPTRDQSSELDAKSPDGPSDGKNRHEFLEESPVTRAKAGNAKVRAVPHNSQVPSRQISEASSRPEVNANGTPEQRIAVLQAADERNRFQMEALMSLLKSKEAEIMHVAEENAKNKQRLKEAQAVETKMQAQVHQLQAELQVQKAELKNAKLPDTNMVDILESQLQQERRTVEKLRVDLAAEKKNAEQLRKQQSGGDPLPKQMEERLVKLEEELANEQRQNMELRNAQIKDSKQWQLRIEQITAEEWTKLTQLETSYAAEIRKSSELNANLQAEMAQTKQLREALATERLRNDQFRPLAAQRIQDMLTESLTANETDQVRLSDTGERPEKDVTDNVSATASATGTLSGMQTPLSATMVSSSSPYLEVSTHVRHAPPEKLQPQGKSKVSPSATSAFHQPATLQTPVSPIGTPPTPPPTMPIRSPGPQSQAPPLWQTQPILRGYGRVTPPRTPPPAGADARIQTGSRTPPTGFACDASIRDPRAGPGPQPLWSTQPVPYGSVARASQGPGFVQTRSQTPPRGGRSVTPTQQRPPQEANGSMAAGTGPSEISTAADPAERDRTPPRTPPVPVLQRVPQTVPVMMHSAQAGWVPQGYPGPQLIHAPPLIGAPGPAVRSVTPPRFYRQ